MHGAWPKHKDYAILIAIGDHASGFISSHTKKGRGVSMLGLRITPPTNLRAGPSW